MTAAIGMLQQTLNAVRSAAPAVMLSLAAWTPAPAAGNDGGAAVPPAELVDFFERRIRPVLVEHCYECHSADAKTLMGGLRLDSPAGLKKGGDSGAVVDSGKPTDSLLLSALKYESFEMPPKGKLPPEVIADFESWIAAGAIDPRQEPAPHGADAAHDAAASKDHWAFRKPQPTSPPAAGDNAPQAEIDRFIVAKLHDAGLEPSAAADARTLLRRVSYDLTGLPPSADELDAFAQQCEHDPGAAPAAYAAAVDRLLESPRFGERWARYWLDVARYADTKGYVFVEDRNYPTAYKYRDWVIGALNADMPYDRFLVAQLAADKTDDASAAPAMGFLTLGRRFLNNPHDINDDRIDLISRGLMGLTTACARCHDHKFDPIPTADYYSLYGVLASSLEKQHDDSPPTLEDAPTPIEQVVFLRGQPGNRGPQVSRHFLSCLVEGEPTPFANGSGRLELAQAIASRDNPLTARVFVNRVWAHLFGRGLVSTPSDFGTRGDAPTHPELLDWLAVTFMDDSWSTKRLIRRMVLSATYQQTSAATDAALAVDSENSLLWRMNRRRLDLEAFRDSVFAAAGTIDLTVGGPSVQLTSAPFPSRRAVYGFIERQNLPAFFRTFDFANPNVHTASRPQTASPQQALFLMNSPLMLEQSHALAARTAGAGGDLQRLERLYRYALGRDPSLEEAADVHEYLTGGEGTADQRWDELAQILLMSNEFMFVD